MKLSNIEKQLIDKMKYMGLERDSIVGIMFALDRESNFYVMLDWLYTNPQADKEAILQQLDDIVGDMSTNHTDGKMASQYATK